MPASKTVKLSEPAIESKPVPFVEKQGPGFSGSGGHPVNVAIGPAANSVRGEHVTVDGELYVCIRNVDALPPFLMSVVSNGDHWLFVGSNTPFTAGRVDPDSAVFPYQTVDKILRHSDTSGALSLFLVRQDGRWMLWEPWSDGARLQRVTRNLYKHVLGTGVIFEEINHDLGMRFRWSLATSERYGFVKHCRLENLAAKAAGVRYLDGLHQIIPPGVDQLTYSKYSYLAGAYMRHECIAGRGLGIYTLNAGITDRAEPAESLRAACAWSLGHTRPVVLLSTRQVDAFRRGIDPVHEAEVRGEFGAYLVGDSVELEPEAAHEWYVVADTQLDHPALVRLEAELAEPVKLKAAMLENIRAGRQGLKRKIAAADGLQETDDRSTSAHHFANALFNCMRGGTFEDSYRFPSADFATFLRSRNTVVFATQHAWLEALPPQLTLEELRRLAAERNDAHLERLAGEYLPLTFSRRHGDPSRPWNRFAIHVKDGTGKPIYGYQGNWRDIFQNWESLALSYPVCLESMIAVFLNSSTADGYNPYRITRDGIDWEVLDPSDPWSNIGYWGDHQIIYLLRLLENFERFDQGGLVARLAHKRYTYAQVPYEIAGFDSLTRDPRNSILFNKELHKDLIAHAATLGNDGKLLARRNGEVLLVSLAEKLLVPLLVKLSNLVPGGGIWMNTQRPEWNDANNALAGWGLSMVTVYHLRRYLVFLDGLLAASSTETLELSAPVSAFAAEMRVALRQAASRVARELDAAARFEILAALGKIGGSYRTAVYGRNFEEQKSIPASAIRELIASALALVDATIRLNRRPDGMYHSYNLLRISGETASVGHLNEMLEGQVAVLGSTFLTPVEALDLLKALRQSKLFRADQQSYLLYPDREIAPLLSRNTLPASALQEAPLLSDLLAAGDCSVVVADDRGALHFQADLANAEDLDRALDGLAKTGRWAAGVNRDRVALLGLWETVFHHSAFTGRSGLMFGFEGLGSIYWHMVAKLLLAVQECHHRAAAAHADPELVRQLAGAYYEVRAGLGFTKSPAVYGAFPSDPYSHTPRDRGAQQPGMTGQVKEELLTRFGEMGIEVTEGSVRFAPALLKQNEFSKEGRVFATIDLHGGEQNWKLPQDSLGFTFCQVPVCYRLSDRASLQLERNGMDEPAVPGNALSRADSRAIFDRTGEITKITVWIPRATLLS